MTTERVQGKSGKWYERTADGWVESDAPAEAVSGGAESQEGPGVLASMMRGVAQSPALMPMTRAMGIGGPLTPGRLSVNNAVMNGPDPAEASQARLAEMSGVAPPTNFAERSAERFGTGAPFSALAGPQLMAMGGIKALGLGVIGDVLSSMSSQFAADRGAGPLGQAMAGFASIAVPSGVAGAGDDLARAGGAVNRFAREAASSAPLTLTPSQTKVVANLADEFGTTSDEIMDSIRTWNDLFPAGTKANPRMHIDEAISKLKESLKTWPDPEVRPLVSQILYEEGGANLAHLNTGLMGQTDANAKAAGLRIRVLRDLNERIDSMAPRSSGPAVNAAAKSAFDKLKLAERAAWDAIPANEMPHIGSGALEAAAQKVTDVEAYRDLVKPEVDVIRRLTDRFGKRVPFNQVQALRSRLLELTRAADGPLADPEVRNRARAAGELLEPIQKYIEALPDNGSEAYKAARAATSSLYDYFPSKSKGIRAILNYEDAKSIVKDVKAVPNSATEVRRVMRALESEPGAVDSLKAAFWDDLLEGKPLSEVPLRAVRGKIRGKHRMYSALFGDMADERTGKRGIEVIDQLLNEATIARREVIGTAAEARVTRSGMRPVQKLLSGVGAVMNPGQTMDKGLQVVSAEIDKVATDKFWRHAIFTELLFDPERAIQFMEIPTPRQVPGWKENFHILVARARARTKMAAVLETDALARTTSQDADNAVSGANLNEGGVR